MRNAVGIGIVFLASACSAATNKAEMEVAIGVGVRCEGSCEVMTEVSGTREGDTKEVQTKTGATQ